MSLNQYHRVIRKINSAFAGLFNNIVVIRQNENDSENQRIKVPIVYANKEKYIKRFEGDFDLNKKIQIVLPIMSYEMTYFKYDASRKLNTVGKNFAQNSDEENTVFMQYNPVPYDIGFSLVIYTRNIEDGHQIIEYILPFFTPEWNLKINLIPEMNIIKTIPIILDQVQSNIDSEGPYDSHSRVVMWTLNFTVKAYIFGAIKNAKIITQVEQDIIFDTVNIGENGICGGTKTKSYILLPNGFGTYSPNEIVYQGLNLENSYANGKVKEYDANNNIITIANICGNFKTNQTLIGSESLSIHVIQRQDPNTVIALSITTIPSPNTANISSNWIANTTIKEYPYNT